MRLVAPGFRACSPANCGVSVSGRNAILTSFPCGRNSTRNNSSPFADDARRAAHQRTSRARRCRRSSPANRSGPRSRQSSRSPLRRRRDPRDRRPWRTPGEVFPDQTVAGDTQPGRIPREQKNLVPALMKQRCDGKSDTARPPEITATRDRLQARALIATIRTLSPGLRKATGRSRPVARRP